MNTKEDEIAEKSNSGLLTLAGLALVGISLLLRPMSIPIAILGATLVSIDSILSIYKNIDW